MAPMIIKLCPHGRIPHYRRLHLHWDNCRVLFFTVIEQFITENRILHLPYPISSPDLEVSGFWACGDVKLSLVGKTVNPPENLPEGVTETLEEI
jgi:hypothetical protein